MDGLDPVAPERRPSPFQRIVPYDPGSVQENDHRTAAPVGGTGPGVSPGAGYGTGVRSVRGYAPGMLGVGFSGSAPDLDG
mmetsp:Transcript_468/g.535  ORF Transcript_468/g.535 Transcript_468/m.535 type:complete len:80 (-) Transcript_468:137-376(-)